MPAKFDPDRDIPDLSGKVIVVTGGNAGLGAETVRKLAVHNPTCIYLCARNPSGAEPMITTIKSQHPNANIIAIKLDLSSLESTKAAAQSILSRTSRLDILYNNAGIALTPPALTSEGYETQFGINHVGHALFTQLLLPTLLRTASTSPPNSVRIINVSSALHARAFPHGLLLADAKTDMSAHHSATRYGHSKLANVLFAKALARRYPSLVSVALHPGFVDTEINRGKAGGAKWLSLLVRSIVGWVGVTVEEGAKTQLWCAVAEGVRSGEYYEPTGVAKQGSKWARNEGLREELWEWTERELRANGGPGWPEGK